MKGTANSASRYPHIGARRMSLDSLVVDRVLDPDHGKHEWFVSALVNTPKGQTRVQRYYPATGPDALTVRQAAAQLITDHVMTVRNGRTWVPVHSD